MSEYSRRKDADYRGFTRCITCVAKFRHWKEMHAGHFFHASKQSQVSYDHRNIHSQCPGCNTYRGGARDHYSVYIKNRYGAGTLDELQELKSQGKPLRRGELEAKIAELEELIEGLEN